MTTPLVSIEIASQPDTWRQAAALAASSPLPRRGQRVAVVGCGTSWFIAQAYAARREGLGHGVTDAFAASEFPTGRDYDLVCRVRSWHVEESDRDTETGITVRNRYAAPVEKVDRATVLPTESATYDFTLAVSDFPPPLPKP